MLDELRADLQGFLEPRELKADDLLHAQKVCLLTRDGAYVRVQKDGLKSPPMQPLHREGEAVAQEISEIVITRRLNYGDGIFSNGSSSLQRSPVVSNVVLLGFL